MASTLEGYGLHQMALEYAFLDNAKPPPIWVFVFFGGLMNGAILYFSGYQSFIENCRELAEKWPWKREVGKRLVLSDAENEARKTLIKAACELIDLNTKVNELEGKLSEDKAALAEKPQVSALALQRIAEAAELVDQEAARLRELLEHATNRMGVLAPEIEMGSVEIPTKVIILPFMKLWIHRSRKGHGK